MKGYIILFIILLAVPLIWMFLGFTTSFWIKVLGFLFILSGFYFGFMMSDIFEEGHFVMKVSLILIFIGVVFVTLNFSP